MLAGVPGVVLAMAVAGSGPPALVPDAPIRWDAPAACPTAADVVERAGVLLGRPLKPGEVEIDATIEAGPAGWTLDLQTGSGQQRDQRRLTAQSCEVLAETTALIAAVLIDPLAAVTTIENQTAPDPAPAPQPEPVLAPEPEVELEPARTPIDPVVTEPASDVRGSRPRSVEGWARIGGGGEFGAVPGGTGGVAVALGLGRGQLRGELVGTYWVGRQVERSGGRATVHLGAAVPRFCGLVLSGAVQLPLCAGIELGAMRADARDVPGAQTRHGVWLAAHAAAGVRWSFRPRLSLWVQAELFVPIVFPSFELVDPSDGTLTAEVYRPNAAGPRGLIGFEYKIF